jgi:hypothetical protein
MGVMLALVCAQATAHAESDPLVRGSASSQFRVRYHAYEGCPSSSEFIRQVLARTTVAQLTKSDDPAHSFEVVIFHRDEGVVGHLGIREPDGLTSVRDLRAASCDEAVAALALIAALTLDPSASTKPLMSRSTAAPSAALPEAPPTRTPEVTHDSPTPRPVATMAWFPAAPEADKAPGPSATGLTGYSGAQAIVTGGIGEVAPGFAMFVGLGRPGRWATRLGVREAVPFTLDTENGSAAFQWIAARLEGCPLTFEPVKWLSVEPCIDAEVGRLRGQGIASAVVTEPMNASALWLAGVASARIRVDVARGIGIELETGLVVPVIEHNFQFRRDTRTIYQVPVVAGTGALGLSLRFP